MKIKQTYLWNTNLIRGSYFIDDFKVKNPNSSSHKYLLNKKPPVKEGQSQPMKNENLSN